MTNEINATITGHIILFLALAASLYLHTPLGVAAALIAYTTAYFAHALPLPPKYFSALFYTTVAGAVVSWLAVMSAL